MCTLQKMQTRMKTTVSKFQQYEIIFLIYILLIFFYAYKCNYFYEVELVLSIMWYTKLCVMNIFLRP